MAKGIKIRTEEDYKGEFSIELMRKKFTNEALKRANGNYSVAGYLLGVSTRTVSRLIKEHSIAVVNKKKY